ncbi:hypothetical protein J7I98_28470 [Streptomyces sp. ISL-98]|nr:hypothetical protein [Streptomyces sp. ISL-98]MBT2509736.1 hypothetical protein [Streptomyces sp. ISL-98]
MPVHTQVLVSVTGRSLAALPETRLLVTAHLGAVLEDGLALRDWETL